ncbi:MAG: LCP family protein, partial [Chloroflexota bacterium]
AVGEYSGHVGLTDTLMLVSINADTGHVAVLSIPRDFYVHVPEMGNYKINQVYWSAERADAGSGIETLYETFLYNFGVEIDYHAIVNFDSFPALINSVGGIWITVDCAIRDWRLIEPDRDPDIEENWEMHTVWGGLHHFDGYEALWYVRSRRTSSDLDRNRRQQDVMRALWRTIRNEGLLENFSSLWEQFNAVVDTNMTLGDALELLPVAQDLSAAEVDYFALEIYEHMLQGRTEGEERRFALFPIRENMITLMQQMVMPATHSRLSSTLPTVAIYNGSGLRNIDYVAAHRLEREGFQTIVTGEYVPPRTWNLIIDHAGIVRNNPVTILQDVLRITDGGVRYEPDPNREYDYELYLGEMYQYNSCTYPVFQPDYEPEATETPPIAVSDEGE